MLSAALPITHMPIHICIIPSLIFLPVLRHRMFTRQVSVTSLSLPHLRSLPVFTMSVTTQASAETSVLSATTMTSTPPLPQRVLTVFHRLSRTGLQPHRSLSVKTMQTSLTMTSTTAKQHLQQASSRAVTAAFISTTEPGQATPTEHGAAQAMPGVLSMSIQAVSQTTIRFRTSEAALSATATSTAVTPVSSTPSEQRTERSA